MEDLSQALTAPADLVCIGGSAGSIEALGPILGALPGDSPLAIVVVVHLLADRPSSLPRLLTRLGRLPAIEADDKMPLRAGRIHVAPPGYHLLVERDGCLSLSTEDPVCFARPSIDVLFESAAVARGGRLTAVLLSGANADGVAGLSAVKARGGLTIVQAPETAQVAVMPSLALALVRPDLVLSPGEIGHIMAGHDRARDRGLHDARP